MPPKSATSATAKKARASVKKPAPVVVSEESESGSEHSDKESDNEGDTNNTEKTEEVKPVENSEPEKKVQPRKKNEKNTPAPKTKVSTVNIDETVSTNNKAPQWDDLKDPLDDCHLCGMFGPNPDCPNEIAKMNNSQQAKPKKNTNIPSKTAKVGSSVPKSSGNGNAPRSSTSFNFAQYAALNTTVQETSTQDLIKALIVRSHNDGQYQLEKTLKHTLRAMNLECDFPASFPPQSFPPRDNGFRRNNTFDSDQGQSLGTMNSQRGGFGKSFRGNNNKRFGKDSFDKSDRSF